MPGAASLAPLSEERTHLGQLQILSWTEKLQISNGFNN